MDKNNFEIIKQSLGNVIYTQKTHEMATIRKLRYVTCVKWMNIIMLGLVFLFLFLQLFNPNEIICLYLGISATVIETLFLVFQLSFHPEVDANKHKQTANKLWLMREKHLNLLTDIKNEVYDLPIISQKRDELTLELSRIYESAPQTKDSDYEKAEKALNGNQKPKADDNEMKNFLPENLQD